MTFFRILLEMWAVSELSLILLLVCTEPASDRPTELLLEPAGAGGV